MADHDPVSLDSSFEQRWADWMALGAERERVTRRQFQIVLPILAIVTAASLYLFVL